MTATKHVPQFDAHDRCRRCGSHFDFHHAWKLGSHTNYQCPIPADAPLPPLPPEFKSKARLYDLFKPCKKCHVKKYVNRENDLCLACEGIP